MSIETACPTCGKQYSAAAELAGRRVRCRGCGEVFPLGGGPPAATPAGARGGPAAPHAGRFGAHPASRFTDAAAAGNPLDDSSPADADAVFAGAFSDYRPPVRPNAGHNFPYAEAVDRWLPVGLAALSLVWLVLQVLGSNNTGAGWAVPLRLALAGLGFLLVVLPLGWLGMSLGCKYAKYQRPSDPFKRVVAVNLFPYVLMVVIWLMVGSLDGAIPGVVVALVVAGGLAWLAYRPTPEEAPIAMSAASGTFLVAVIACGLLALAVNEAGRAIVRSSRTPVRLAASPVGPGLDWDAPPEPAPTARPAGMPNTTADDGASPVPPPEPSVASTDGSETAPAAPTTVPAPRSPAVAPGPVASADPPGADPFAASPLFRRPETTTSVPRPTDDAPGTAEPPAPSPPRPTAPAVSPGVSPAAGGTGDPLVDRIRAARSPLVAEVRPIGAIKPFARAVFPMTPSPMMLVTRLNPGGAADVGEVWDLSRFQQVAAGPLPRDEAGRGIGGAAGGNLALSPSGQTVARATSFPTRGVELLSLNPPRPPAHFPFPATTTPNAIPPTAEASVAGFAGDGRVMVRWQAAGQVGIQVLDVRTKTYGKLLELPNHVPTAANQAVSADGRFYGVVGDAAADPRNLAREAARAASLIDTVMNTVRRVPITGIDAQWAPTAAAFSHDGKRFCVQYERNGQVVVLTPNVAPPQTIVLQAGKVPPAAAGAATAGRLVPLANGKAWLIGGNVVVDADKGRPMGELGVGEPLDLRADGDSVFLLHGEPNARKLLLLKLASVMSSRPMNGGAAAPRPAARPGN